MALTMLHAAHATGHPFGLVLLDEQMPSMDGFSVIEAVRANPQLAGAAIMMLTSSNQTTSAARCRSLGVETYLIKPIHQPELHTAIRKALGKTELPQKHQPAIQDQKTHRTLRILLAEDNAVNQKLAISLLTKMGHDVTLALNGREAVEKSAAEPFDLIFMDVQMPEMDGFEATREIRSREHHSGTHVPIVAMTAHAMNSDQERCLSAGMDDYVTKPFSRNDLITAIDRASDSLTGPKH